jgi:CubicO group peptidase (beta-lactamase class C family)
VLAVEVSRPQIEQAGTRRLSDPDLEGAAAKMTRVLQGLLLLFVAAVSTAAAAEPAPIKPDAIDEIVRSEMARRRIPGLALAVVRDGAIVKMQSYGLANLEHDVPITTDTEFELASLTKQFTAAAIMRLAEAGRLKLDDPIAQHLPDAPQKWKPIMIRHLLTHTSGLPGLKEGFGTLNGGIDFSTQAMFNAAAADPIGFAAGLKFQYSDVGYFLLGMIIERASGTRYGAYLTQEFFKPLGMNSTSLLDQWQVLKHRAAGYTLRNGEVVNIRRVWQTELPSHYGVFSSVADLATWEIALSSGKVLRESSLKEMWTPVTLNDGKPFPYGFGWEIEQSPDRRVITHTGVTGTEFTRYPEDKLTVIVLTNLGLRIGDNLDPVNAWGLTKLIAAPSLK